MICAISFDLIYPADAARCWLSLFFLQITNETPACISPSVLRRMARQCVAFVCNRITANEWSRWLGSFFMSSLVRISFFSELSEGLPSKQAFSLRVVRAASPLSFVNGNDNSVCRFDESRDVFPLFFFFHSVSGSSFNAVTAVKGASVTCESYHKADAARCWRYCLFCKSKERSLGCRVVEAKQGAGSVGSLIQLRRCRCRSRENFCPCSAVLLRTLFSLLFIPSLTSGFCMAPPHSLIAIQTGITSSRTGSRGAATSTAAAAASVRQEQKTGAKQKPMEVSMVMSVTTARVRGVLEVTA